MQLLLAAVLLIAVCPTAQLESETTVSLPGPNAEVLRSLPGVHSVVVYPASKGATHRIIHIRNWHFVPKADFAADLRSLEGEALSDEEIDTRYDEFLAEVDTVQAEQRKLLMSLIENHGLKQVAIEGLTKDEMPTFDKRIKVLRDFEKHKPTGDSPIDLFILEMNRHDLLEIGAAGQLYLQGKLGEVLPAEEAGVFEQANPVSDDGKVVFDEKRNVAREDAVVRTLLKAGPLSVIVMGGAHDLTDNAERLSHGTCEVIVVTMKAYQQVVTLEEAGSQPQHHNVTCEGTYRHHLQGICVDDEAIYWSFTTALVKTDLNGKLLKKMSVANHHGDLCHHDGKLYVAVNLGKFNDPKGNSDSWVYVYDAATLKEIARHEVQEVFHGAGGIGFRDDHFFVVGGLPDGVEENYVYEYDGQFKLVKKHVIKSGHTHLGIQTATFAHDRWWFGCYGDPTILLVTDAAFQMKGRYEYDCSLGIEGLPDGRLLSAFGRCEKDKGCTGSVQLVGPDEKTGLKCVPADSGNDK